MYGTRSPAHRPSARLPASTGLSPAAHTATRTWPVPATGSATRTGRSCSGPPNSLTSTAFMGVPSVGAAHQGNEVWLILRVGHAAVGTHQAAHRDAVGVEFGLAVAPDLGPGQPGPAGAGGFDGFCNRGDVRGALPLPRERFLEQCGLISLERRGHQVHRAVDRDRDPLPGHPAHQHDPAVRDIARTDFDTDRVALEFGINRAAAERHTDPLVEFDPYSGATQRGRQRVRNLGDATAFPYDQDGGLHRGQAGRHAEPEVVTMSHDDAPDKAGRDTP